MTGPNFVRPEGAAARGAVAAPVEASHRRTVPAAPHMTRATPRSLVQATAPPTPHPAGQEHTSATRAATPRRWRTGWQTPVVTAVVSASLAVGAVGAVSALREDDAPLRPPAVATESTLGQVAARALPSVVSVQVRWGGRGATGSGFVVEPGVIVTNAHVVDNRAADVRVRLSNGETVDADVLGLSAQDDLAVLRARLPDSVDPLPLADASTPTSVGDEVIAVGSPLGLAGTVTAGIVSATDREVRLGTTRASAIQTDASINPGNSGGPLIDRHGRVIGVNTSIASIGGGNIGIGFAIPAERVRAVVDRLVTP